MSKRRTETPEDPFPPERLHPFDEFLFGNADLLGHDRKRPFLNRQIGALLDDVLDLWQRLPSDISPKRRRRRRLAVGIVKRLRGHLLNRFTLPEIDTAQAAAKLYQLLRCSGIREIFAEIHCVLERFDEAVNAVDDIRAALPLNIGGDSVGAAIIEPEGAARYCWYASWLLSDVDLPLLGSG